jgi:Phosphotransferase enzyme family
MTAAATWWDDGSQTEIPLLGGDVTEGVVRVGDTVRRPLNANSPFVHALLSHLEAVGFTGAPRFLGIDTAGREVLSFVEGEVAGRPRPPWIADEDRMVSVARLIRAYDDAAATFVSPEGITPVAMLEEGAGIPPAPPGEPELVCHLDITPENVVFRDAKAFALIDFDLARTATRADEVSNLMLWWAPLFDPQDVEPVLRDLDVPRRCRMLADAYGMSEADRARVIEVTIMRTRRSWYLMKQLAERDGGGWLRMWNEGVGDIINRREAWLGQNAAALQAALTAPGATV